MHGDGRVHVLGERVVVSLDSKAIVAGARAVAEVADGPPEGSALAAEAVIVFDPALAKDMAYRRKRAGQMPSKGRFNAAQLLRQAHFLG